MKYKKITFPKDVFPHGSVIEWWYFNGHLKDSRGNNYSFMSCLFRADAKKAKIPLINRIPFKYVYFYHSIFFDLEKKISYQDIKPIVIVSEDRFTKKLFYVDFTSPSLKGYINYEIEELSRHKFRLKTKFFDIVLDSVKPPLLEGGKGFVSLDSKETFYYSLTNMESKGQIIIDGKRIKVKGKSWMDHQWADVPYQKDKWSWFCMQLDNDTEIVCFEFDDKKNKYYLASMMLSNGKAIHTSDVFVKPHRGHKSKKTGAVYPLKWGIVIPDFRLDVETRSLINSEEVMFGSINYWECPIEIKGSLNNKPIQGKGFIELASYPMKKSIGGIYRKQLIGILDKELNQTKKRMKDIERSILKN